MIKLFGCHDSPNTFNILLFVNIDLFYFEPCFIINNCAATPGPAPLPPVGEHPVACPLHQVLQGHPPPFMIPYLCSDCAIRSYFFKEGLEIFNLVVYASEVCDHTERQGGWQVKAACGINLQH